MKKILYCLVAISLLLSGCNSIYSGEGIVEYIPDFNAPKDWEADLPTAYSDKVLVARSSVIVVATIKDMKHIMVSDEEDMIVNQKGILCEFKITKILFTHNGLAGNRNNARAFMAYDETIGNYETVPDMNTGSTVILFLSYMPEDAPENFRDNFQYWLLNDSGDYKIEMSDENLSYVRKLIADIGR